jgi:hypothetical protein
MAPSRRRSRAFRAFERFVLGIGLTVVAFVIERRLLKAIKGGVVEPAPRTAAGPGEEIASEGELATASNQVQDQAPG